MNDLKFDESDPISILTFLATLTKEADKMNLSEGTAHKIVPKFLTGAARTVLMAIRKRDRVSRSARQKKSVPY